MIKNQEISIPFSGRYTSEVGRIWESPGSNSKRYGDLYVVTALRSAWQFMPGGAILRGARARI